MRTEMKAATMASISLTALDVGYSLRVVGYPVVIGDWVQEVKYDDQEYKTHVVKGNRKKIVAALKRAGYNIAPSTTAPKASGEDSAEISPKSEKL